MSADASWPCFARETGLNSNTQGSLSTKLSQSITLHSGSFPVVIISTFRSMQAGNLLINANNTPHCLFWEFILHTLVITVRALVVREAHTADTHIPALCQQSVQWLRFHYMDAAASSGERQRRCPKLILNWHIHFYSRSFYCSILILHHQLDCAPVSTVDVCVCAELQLMSQVIATYQENRWSLCYSGKTSRTLLVSRSQR